MGMQVLPLHPVIQHLQDTPHHEYSHPKDFCPRKPGGACECADDTHSSSTDEPVLTSCDGADTTVDLQTGVQLMDRVQLALGVENLFDVSYTNHLNAKNPFSGAQIPEPGRVFTTNLTIGF